MLENDNDDRSEKLEEMTVDMESVKSEIQLLKNQLNKANIFKAKAIYSFQLKKLAHFFETGGNYMSEHFYCQGERSRAGFMSFQGSS